MTYNVSSGTLSLYTACYLEKQNGRRWKSLVGGDAGRTEAALQQNEIMDVFYDDWAALTIDDGSFGSKADNHLKVCNDHNSLMLF